MKKDLNLITLHESKTIKDAMAQLQESGVRAVLIVDENNKLRGIVTDGDIRKALLEGKDMSFPVREIMIENLKTATKDTPATELLDIMLQLSILHIPILNKDGAVQGIALLSELKSIPLSSQDITTKEIDAINKVMASPYLSIGPQIKELEEVLAKFVGAKYAVAVNSGTSALHLMMRSFNIKDGDEVITTPFSFIASANCILFERAKPVFVDIDPETLCIDPARIEEKITPRTKAILPVHVFGHPADMDPIREIAERHNLVIIEDSCEALGSEYKGRKVGLLGNAGAFAFYPNKQITTGEGGIIVTNDGEVAKLCRSMRNQGRDEGDAWLSHSRLGYNYRMSELNAAVGVVQMERIEEIIGKRSAVAAAYAKHLVGISGVSAPYISPDVKMSWFVYVVRLDADWFSRGDRDEIIKQLQVHGVSARNYFPPIHLEPFYVNTFGFKEGDFPITEKISGSTIALPFYNNLTEEEIIYITKTLKSVTEAIKNKP